MENSGKGKPKVTIEQNIVAIIFSCRNQVLEKIRQFKDKSLYCDVDLIAKSSKDVSLKKKGKRGTSEIKAHSCVLAAGSTLCQKMFRTKSSTAKKGHFFKDVTMENLNICVDFLYRKNVTFPFDEMGQVIKSAKTLGIQELEMCCMSATKQHCDEATGMNIDPSNNQDEIQGRDDDSDPGLENKSMETSNLKLPNMELSLKEEGNLTYEEDVIDSMVDENYNSYSGDENNDDSFDEAEETGMDIENAEIVSSINKERRKRKKAAKKIELKKIIPEELLGKSFYCCHCKEMFSVSQHYCSVVKKEMRLRLSYACQVCGEVVSSAHLSRHRKKHPEGNDGNPIFILERRISGKQFYCRFCDQNFDIGTHFCSARGRKIRLRARIVCHHCGVELSGDSFARHMQNVHTMRQQQCEICGYMAYGKEDHHDHSLTHYNGKTFPCELCGKIYRGPHSLGAHKYKVHDVVKPRKRFKNDRIFKCPECDFENYSSTMVCIHIVKEHKKSDSEVVRRFIYVYNKKKNGKKDAIKEFETLKEIIEKKEPPDLPVENNVKLELDLDEHHPDLPAENSIKRELYPSELIKETNKHIVKKKRGIRKKKKDQGIANNVMIMSESGTSESYYGMIKFSSEHQSFTVNDPDNLVILSETGGEIHTDGNLVRFQDEKSHVISHELLTDTHNNTVVISNDNQLVQFAAPNETISVVGPQASGGIKSEDCKNVILRIIEDGQLNIGMGEEVIGENIEVVSEINVSDLQSGSVVTGDIHHHHHPLRLVVSPMVPDCQDPPQ